MASVEELTQKGEALFAAGDWSAARDAFQAAQRLEDAAGARALLLAQWLRKCECELKAAAGEPAVALTAAAPSSAPPAAPPAPPAPRAAPPAAAGARKKGPKDWSALERELEEEEKAEAASATGDAALNALFRTIYAGADDDTRRAMQKSYVESAGTCLSTNWKEVGKAPVPVTPPDGQVHKKMGQ